MKDKRYTVDLYNIDTEAYTTAYKTDSKAEAQAVRKALDELCKKHMVIDKAAEDPKPYGFADIYDHEFPASRIIIEIGDEYADKYDELTAELTSALEYADIRYDLCHDGRDLHIRTA